MLRKKLILLLMMIFIGTTVYPVEKIRVTAPDGLPALALVKMINEDNIIGENEIEYKIEKISESLVMELMKKNADIAIVPSNLAGQLYNKGLGYKIAGTVGWGSFYVISRENIDSVDKLKGEEVYTIGKGLTPDIILQTILRENKIVPQKDIKINYLTGGNELAPLYLAKKIDKAVVSEPILSRILSKDNKTKINISLNDEWKKIFKTERGYPQSTLIVSKELLEKNPKLVDEFIEKLKESTAFIRSDDEKREEYLKNAGLTTVGIDILSQVTERADIGFTSAKDDAKEYMIYFEKIAENDKKAIGGKIPDEKIFISK